MLKDLTVLRFKTSNQIRLVSIKLTKPPINPPARTSETN